MPACRRSDEGAWRHKAYQGESWIVRVHLQRLMHRVHDDVKAPHKGGGGSCNLDGQHKNPIPEVASQVQGLCTTHVQIETKRAKVEKGDDAALDVELAASLELAGRECACKRRKAWVL